MKAFLFLLCSLGLFGQTPAAAPAPSTLPPYVLGIGGTWDRGATGRFAIDATVAVLLKNTQFYWWSDISTPLAKGVNGSPVPSTITTGGAWVAASNSRVSLVIIMTAGFSISTPQASAGSTVAPAFSGSLGVPIKIGQSGNWAVMPYIKALATSSATPPSAAGVSSVIQPGIQVQFNFGGTHQ